MQKLNNKKNYSEIYEILNILGQEYINKLPKKLYELIESQRDIDYKPKLLMENGMLDENLISRETIALFAVINIKYFVEDENEKQKYMDLLKENEQIYQTELREKYNPDDLFKNNILLENNETKTNENIQMIEYKKENIFRKIFNKIKNFLKINK